METDNKAEDLPRERVLLEETFYVLTKKNSVFRVRLTKNGLSLIKECENNFKEQTIPIKDIIGCRCMRSKKQRKSCSCQSLPRTSLKVVDENSGERDDSDVSAYLYIYAYILQCSRGIPTRRERTIITLRFRSFDKYEDNHKEAQRWRTAIKQLIRGENVTNTNILDFTMISRPKEDRRILVLLNPKSGAGKGRNIFQQKIVPMLLEAEVPYDLHITKHANFARQFIRTCNIFQWNGILVVGGDGILFEVINGLFERWDWSKAIQQVPLGIVPGGSGNGLARSIAYCCNEPYLPCPTLPSALAAVKTLSHPMDLVRVETTSQIIFSFLSVGWGLLSDVDIESERLRMLGGQRFTVWCVARLIGLRTYRGKVTYLPANQPIVPATTNVTIGDNIELPPEVTLETQTNTGRQRLDSWYSAASRRSAYFSTTGSSYQSTADSALGGGDDASDRPRMYGPASQLPCLTTTLPPSWTTIEGGFVMVHASYQTHLGEDVLFAPNAKLDDGIIWLLIIKDDITRSQLLQFLLGLSTGAHAQNSVTNEGPIILVPVRAFRIEPDMTENGYMTVDGEHVEYGPIQAEIFPSLGRVMVP